MFSDGFYRYFKWSWRNHERSVSVSLPASDERTPCSTWNYRGSHQTPIWLSREAQRIKHLSRSRSVTYVALICYCLQQPTALGYAIRFCPSAPILAFDDSCTTSRTISVTVKHNKSITVHTFPTGVGSTSCFAYESL